MLRSIESVSGHSGRSSSAPCLLLFRTRLENERSPSDLTSHQAAALRLRIGAADRSNRDTQLSGQVAVGRQPGARLQNPLLNVARQGIGYPQVARAGTLVQIGHPHCHHDKV